MYVCRSTYPAGISLTQNFELKILWPTYMPGQLGCHKFMVIILLQPVLSIIYLLNFFNPNSNFVFGGTIKPKKDKEGEREREREEERLDLYV